MKSLFALVAGVVAFTMISTQPTQAAEAPYRHVVLFKFKEGTTPEKLKEIEAAARTLLTQIETVTDFEWGTNISPENKNQGFTHCYFLTFKDQAGLQAYLPHPKHKEFGKQLSGAVDKVLVVDFVAQK